MQNTFYRKYNLVLVIASFIFLQYYLSHLPPADQWSVWTIVFAPVAVLSGIVIYDLLVRARFSNIEKGKEEYASWVLKQVKDPLDFIILDMGNNLKVEGAEKHLSHFYKKLKDLSSLISKNIAE